MEFDEISMGATVELHSRSHPPADRNKMPSYLGAHRVLTCTAPNAMRCKCRKGQLIQLKSGLDQGEVAQFKNYLNRGEVTHDAVDLDF